MKSDSSLIQPNDWHAKQDIQITKALDALSVVQNSESAFIRLRALGDELLMQKHFHNVVSEKRKYEEFSVFDMGCGQGDILEKIALHFPNVELHGLDANLTSVEKARERCPKALITQGLFQNVVGQYDVVVCCEVFEHVEDYRGLLDKLHAITKPGGLLSISTPSGWMWRNPSEYTIKNAIRNWAWYRRNYLRPEENWQEALRIHPAIWPKKLIKLCESRGFTLLSRQSSLWHLQMDGWLARTFQRLEKRNPNKAAIDYINIVTALDAIMNCIPFFRFKETRFVLALRKPKSRA